MEDAINETLDHILFIARRFSKEDLPSVILLILLELHIPTMGEGSYYLRKAIELNCRNPSMVHMKSLYQLIAPGINYSTMEQAIRGAIRTGYRTGSMEKWNIYFQEEDNIKAHGPSNAQFITKIARILELWQNCSEEVSHERI